MKPNSKIKRHFTRGGPRVLCGRQSSETAFDTRKKKLVTCNNCKRVLAAEAK